MDKLFPPEIIEHSTHTFFSENRVNRRWFSWTLVFMMMAGVLFISFFTVDVSVTAKGTIRSPFENNVVYSVVNARIRNTTISRNASVVQGDTLIVFEDAGIRNEIVIVNNQIQENIDYVTDVTSLLGNRMANSLVTSFYKRDAELCTKELDVLAERVRKLQQDFARTKKLFNQKVIPASEYETLEFDLKLAQRQYASAIQKWNGKWETDLKSYIEKEAFLNTSLKNLQFAKDKYVIVSNVTGTVVEYCGVQAGDLVSAGMNIATISPDGNLIVECLVGSADIGLIKKEMPVLIQVDAYNYNEWGMVDAVVLEVSDDVQTFNRSVSFGVRCQMNQIYLSLQNGVKGKFKKGMSVTGRFIVTQRTVFQLFFDKVDDWLNPNLIAEN